MAARLERGTVCVRRPGSNKFVELDRSPRIPFGSTVDAKTGRVRITARPGEDKTPQRAKFYDGIFTLTQPGTIVDLKLVEELARCPSSRKACAAAKKPKSRQLLGRSGKGRLGTTGQNSAATIHGRTRLVQDVCAVTLTRATGVVAVRDKRLKKTILVRKSSATSPCAGLSALTNRTLREALISGYGRRRCACAPSYSPASPRSRRLRLHAPRR